MRRSFESGCGEDVSLSTDPDDEFPSLRDKSCIREIAEVIVVSHVKGDDVLGSKTRRVVRDNSAFGGEGTVSTVSDDKETMDVSENRGTRRSGVPCRGLALRRCIAFS